MGAHAAHFIEMLQPGFKDGFNHDGIPAGLGEQSAHGLLKIGGEAGVFLGFDIHGPVAPDGAHPDGVVHIRHLHAHFQ